MAKNTRTFDGAVELTSIERPKGAIKVNKLVDGSFDIRFYYTNAEGELLPSPKGVILEAEEAKVVVGVLKA